MKKMIALLLVLVMAVSLFAACGSEGGSENGGASENGEEAKISVSAIEALEAIWAQYDETEKFPIYGGFGEDMVENAPGKINELEYLQNTLYVPQEEIINISEAAYMQNAFNANTFSCGALKLAEGVDLPTFATTMKDILLNNQWMCGFPEKLVIASVSSDCVVIAFGKNDAMTPFQTNLAEAYADANVLFAEDFA